MDVVPPGGDSSQVSALGRLLSELGRLAVDEPDLFRRAAAGVASALSDEARDQALAGERGTPELAAAFARTAEDGAMPNLGPGASGSGAFAAYSREQRAMDRQRAEKALESALADALPA